MRRASGILCGSGVLALTACAGHQQSAVDPAGPQAGHIANLWWFFFAVLAAIFLAVMAFALWTLTRRHRGIEQEPLEGKHKPSEATESRLTRVVAGLTIATVLILFVLLVSSITTGKSISELRDKQHGLIIEVTGNQWWWQFRYMNDDSNEILITANEIHIPVGRPVMIRGMSQDVIHSFWAPNLNGKRDLIPSRITEEWIQADHAGAYRGQCAEFCGLQHAHMVFWVVAEAPDKFKQWFDAQLQPAAAPGDADTLRGQQVFLNNACIFCHTIRGTPAAAQNGPDLTHFGSRRSIAAGTLPNTPGNLGGWIVDPQSIKPGNHMATIALNSSDLQPLIDYLESLK
ncbi:MAG TPA: cytochrome c oxidase subunit II [Bryobacteraceae bacterium]|jgi:cytochrome c oxidase subunit 2|nr:cytochrome c oxidase subunit II [Bryobacteraceae bacterium]